MRILYYNWVDYLDDEGRGGGVSIYQRNLLQAIDRREGVEATFLSSGLSYDLFSRRPRWTRVRHGARTDRARRYEIVNSGVTSPAHHSFGDPAQIDHPATVEALADFIAATGPYDVLHFNNLEGLPATALEVAGRFPEMKVVLTLHNYYPVCPQVNLWHQERETCRDFDAGRACIDCLEQRPNGQLIRQADAVAFRLKTAGIRPGTMVFDGLFWPGIRIAARLARGGARLARLVRPRSGGAPGAAARSAEAARFARRRETFVRLINRHCHRVLCVSDAVGAVAAGYGLRTDLLQTSYIGTAHADKFAATEPRPALLNDDGTLTLAFLGYMRRDKGFFFLLDALEALPDATAARLRLIVAARGADRATLARFDRLRGRLAELTHVDGYSHEGLDALLAEAGLGVVPVLWHDNLPQVAIEMHARHIPILTSDMGGAQELGRCPGLVFRAGDAGDFAARIEDVLAGRVTPGDYWRGAMAPVAMESHLDALLDSYAAPSPAVSGDSRAATNGLSRQGTETAGS